MLCIVEYRGREESTQQAWDGGSGRSSMGEEGTFISRLSVYSKKLQDNQATTRWPAAPPGDDAMPGARAASASGRLGNQ